MSWIGLFIVTTILTNASSFGFPFVTFMPSYAIGVLSLLILPLVIAARYWKHLAGGWRTVFVLGTVVTLYLNVFVLVAQLFHRVPAMIALAPHHKEPPFLLTQLLVLAMFVVLGRSAYRRFDGRGSASAGSRGVMDPMPAGRP